MPFLRFTLSALRNQAMQDITASPLPGADGLLSKAVLRVLALVQAGMAFLHYDYLDWISQMSTPWGAQAEYASAWGALIGVSQKDATTAGMTPATPGAATFTGNVPTTRILNGSPLSRLDGTPLVSTADATVDGFGNVVVPIAAGVAGAIGNTAVGSVVRLSTPIPGINSTGSCTLAIVGGAEQETPDIFKARYLAQFSAPPQGGDRGDYIAWTLAIPGVTRAWVLPGGNGAGTVVVYPMLDNANGATGGFPVGSDGVAAAEVRGVAATGDQLTVANAILVVQPVTALVYAASPMASPVAFSITSLAPNTAAVQAGIAAALADMFLRLDQVGGTVDPVTGLPWGTLYPSDWESAIGAVPGINHFTVAAPILPLTPATGALFTLGTLTFAS